MMLASIATDHSLSAVRVLNNCTVLKHCAVVNEKDIQHVKTFSELIHILN